MQQRCLTAVYGQLPINSSRNGFIDLLYHARHNTGGVLNPTRLQKGAVHRTCKIGALEVNHSGMYQIAISLVLISSTIFLVDL